MQFIILKITPKATLLSHHRFIKLSGCICYAERHLVWTAFKVNKKHLVTWKQTKKKQQSVCIILNYKCIKYYSINTFFFSQILRQKQHHFKINMEMDQPRHWTCSAILIILMRKIVRFLVTHPNHFVPSTQPVDQIVYCSHACELNQASLGLV